MVGTTKLDEAITLLKTAELKQVEAALRRAKIKGARKRSDMCPIAIYLKKSGASEAWANSRMAGVMKTEEYQSFHLSPGAQGFIRGFDGDLYGQEFR